MEEGIRASKAGVDAVGTTLSGYTPYSKNPIIFGTVPSPDPDYEIIKELKTAGVSRVIAEGRINDGSKTVSYTHLDVYKRQIVPVVVMSFLK